MGAQAVLSSNVFALLDDENEDPQQLAAAAAKAAPVKEAKKEAPKAEAKPAGEEGTAVWGWVGGGPRPRRTMAAAAPPPPRRQSEGRQAGVVSAIGGRLRRGRRLAGRIAHGMGL